MERSATPRTIGRRRHTRRLAYIAIATLACFAAAQWRRHARKPVLAREDVAGLRDAVAERSESDVRRLSAEDLLRAVCSAAVGPDYRDAVAAAPAPGEPLIAAPQRLPALFPPNTTASARASVPYWRLVFSPVVLGVMIVLGLGCGGASLVRARPAPARRPAPASGGDGKQPAAQAPTLPLALVPSGYRLVKALAEGGMGVVSEAEDAALGRRVAIKKLREELKANASDRRRLLGEARLVAGLHHPNIVEIYTVVEENGELYLVFEFVPGRTLHAAIAEKGFLPLPDCKRILAEVCRALDFAHARGIVHRDLKPSNIMLSASGEVKVMDFGIAHQTGGARHPALTQSVAGTPFYMAPEAQQGVVRRESDVYSLGACFYEMATGRRPFSEPVTPEAKLRQCYVPPSRQRTGLTPAVDALVDWALEPDPDARIRSAGEFYKALSEVAG